MRLLQLSRDLQTLKVIDFGASKRVDSNGEFEWDAIATEPYGPAPERVHCSYGADAFAFGLVLLQLIEPHRTAHDLAKEHDFGTAAALPTLDERVRAFLAHTISVPAQRLISERDAGIRLLAILTEFARRCRFPGLRDRPAMAVACQLLPSVLHVLAVVESLFVLFAAAKAPLDAAVDYLLPELDDLCRLRQ